MPRKGSRYENTRGFSPPADGGDVFPGLRPRDILHAEGVIEHHVVSSDRLDLLARHYYSNGHLWWRIGDANPEFLFAGDTDEDVILIPRARR